MTGRVEILLATYNSASYLGALLDSLLAQTYDGFHLVVSDDGSQDETLEILRSYQDRFRHPPRIIERETPSGSAMANFGSLLMGCGADYALLCDHDDLWHPDRVAVAVERIKAAEAEIGVETPILYHSDLEVIDAEGRAVHPSYWRYKQIAPSAGQHLPTALMHATVTGCAAAMNRALIKRAGAVPEQAIMHDWWLNLVAAAFGRVEIDPTPRVSYRIHGQNVSAPREVGIATSFRQLDRLRRVRLNIRRRYAQGRALHTCFAEGMPQPARDQIAAFVRLQRVPPPLRQMALMRGGFRWPGLWRNLVQMLFA